MNGQAPTNPNPESPPAGPPAQAPVAPATPGWVPTQWSPPPSRAPDPLPPELAALSQEDLVKAAQTGLNTDVLLADAAKERKTNESARQFQDDMQLVTDTGDTAAFRRAAASLGMPGDRVEDAIRKVDATVGTEPLPGQPPAQDPAGPSAAQEWQAKIAEVKEVISNRKVDVNNLSPDLQELMASLEDRRVNEIIQNALDKDEHFRYYMGESDQPGQEAIRGMVRHQCEQYLAQHTSDGYFGDGQAALRDALPTVKSTLQALKVGQQTTPPLGIGSAPGSGLGAEGLNLPPNKPPERIPVSHPEFGDYIGKVLEHHIRQTEGGA